ncbi:unnamed protein product [Symbiodinium sp. CCMP2592]|nr:unnamed protein product [Symbiodinium sp. CCMP2592]
MTEPGESAVSIYQNGFFPSKAAKGDANFGDGVYVSRYIGYAATYAKPVEVRLLSGVAKVQVAWQVAVRPGSFRKANDNIWVVPDPADVRFYGLLIKEAK